MEAVAHKAEITVTYGNGQQINIVTSHPDMSTAAAMASLQVLKKMKSIVDTEAFESDQKAQLELTLKARQQEADLETQSTKDLNTNADTLKKLVEATGANAGNRSGHGPKYTAAVRNH